MFPWFSAPLLHFMSLLWQQWIQKTSVHKTIITSGKAGKDEPITGHNETTDESSLVEYYNVLGLSFRYETVKSLGPALVQADFLFHLPQYVK